MFRIKKNKNKISKFFQKTYYDNIIAITVNISTNFKYLKLCKKNI